MTNYVIFGSGRVGGNMTAYLQGLGHKVSLVSHKQSENAPSECIKLIESADIVAAAVPDDRLKPWLETWRETIGVRTAIHFSGAVSIDGMYGFHPLYSFPRSGVPNEAMKEIGFACPVDGPSFKDVFPGAPNPHFQIAEKDRARYHALAVLSGNLVGFIWNETAKEFAAYSSTSSQQSLESYLNSVLDRFVENPTESLTGPIARRDIVTVKKNLAGLSDNPKLKGLYEAFLVATWPDYEAVDSD